MRKFLGAGVGILLLVAVALVFVPSVRHRLSGRVAGDPVVEGEPLRYWLFLVREGKTKEERASAASALGQFGPGAPEGVSAALLTALSDAEPLVRKSAALALGKLGPSAEVTAGLLVVLGDKEGDVRAAAATALGELKSDDPAVLPALLKVATGDPDVMIRVAAITAVGRYGDRPEAVPALIDFLKENDSPRGSPHECAVLSLKEVGPVCLPALTQALGRKEPRTRIGVLKVLTLLGPTAGPALPDVEKRLADEDPLVGLEALQCLWAIERKVERVVPAAREHLHTKEANPRKRGQIRIKAIYVLGEVGPDAKAAVPDLLAVLKDDPESHLRRYAARALGKMGPAPEIVEGLKAAAKTDQDPDVCGAANEALKNIGQS